MRLLESKESAMRSLVNPPVDSLEAMATENGDDDGGSPDAALTTDQTGLEYDDDLPMPEDFSDEEDRTVAEATHAALGKFAGTHFVKIHAQARCVAHSLQSCIRTAVSQNNWIKDALDYSKDLIRCFRKRTHMSDDLKDIAAKGLVAPCDTRWNTNLDTLVRITQVFDIVLLSSLSHYLQSNRGYDNFLILII